MRFAVTPNSATLQLVRAMSCRRMAVVATLRFCFVVILLCAVASCEENPVTIASSQARSPDGGWTAISRTDQSSGPGNADLIVVVSLKRTDGTADPIEILGLDEPHNKPANIDLTLTWLTPSHLEISYREPAPVVFHKAKYMGIDISLRGID
jgi:hypothetical protein